MKSYAWTYLDLREVCDYNQLDYGNVMDAISNSDVSFGTNTDTLISQETLQSIPPGISLNTGLVVFCIKFALSAIHN